MTQQPPQQPIQYQMPPSVPGSGMGIASLVLGIISLCVFCFLPLSILLGVVAIILGVISIAQAGGAPTGKAKAGIALAGIGMIVGIGFWVTVTFILKKAGDTIQQHQGDIQKSLEDAGKQIDAAVKKQQEELQKQQQEMQQRMKDQNMPMTQPGVMLTHPDGWSVYIA